MCIIYKYMHLPAEIHRLQMARCRQMQSTSGTGSILLHATLLCKNTGTFHWTKFCKHAMKILPYSKVVHNAMRYVIWHLCQPTYVFKLGTKKKKKEGLDSLLWLHKATRLKLLPFLINQFRLWNQATVTCCSYILHPLMLFYKEQTLSGLFMT